MDSASTAGLAGRKKRQMRSAAEKLRIVEETLAPGASVALVARAARSQRESGVQVA